MTGTDIEMKYIMQFTYQDMISHVIFQDIKIMAGAELLELLNHVVFSIIGVGGIGIIVALFFLVIVVIVKTMYFDANTQ